MLPCGVENRPDDLAGVRDQTVAVRNIIVDEKFVRAKIPPVYVEMVGEISGWSDRRAGVRRCRNQPVEKRRSATHAAGHYRQPISHTTDAPGEFFNRALLSRMVTPPPETWRLERPTPEGEPLSWRACLMLPFSPSLFLLLRQVRGSARLLSISQHRCDRQAPRVASVGCP